MSCRNREEISLKVTSVGSRGCVWIFAADGEAGSIGHAVKLRAMIGRCDGWMGPMESRGRPPLSGCYRRLRGGMRVGNEEGAMQSEGHQKSLNYP